MQTAGCTGNIIQLFTSVAVNIRFYGPDLAIFTAAAGGSTSLSGGAISCVDATNNDVVIVIPLSLIVDQLMESKIASKIIKNEVYFC